MERRSLEIAQGGQHDDLVHPIPGTVRLIDEQHRLRVKHSDTNSDVVLVPAPSEDPDDPLNWSHRRKLLSTACTCLYTLLLGISTSAIYSVLVPVSKATGLSVSELNQGTGYMFLLFGWGCLFWQPVALQYGKRIVYILSMTGTIAVMIWQPHTKTSGQYLASKIIQGFFGAPIESLCEISLADIWFQHERGKFLALYGFLLAGSNYLAPLLMGFINDGQGWQWCFYWCAIFVGVALLFNLIFMEETNWNRASETSTHSALTYTSETGDVTPTGDEKATPTKLHTASVTPSTDGVIDTTPAKSRKTFWQKMSLMPQRQPFRLWKILPRPFLYFTLPAIVWSGFAYGLSLVWANVINATASSILYAAPYHFKSSFVGLAYLAPLIGAAISALYSGNLGDWLVLRMARRNGGISEAEHRLWLFGVQAIIMPFALILWGVGAAHHIHWFGLIFAIFIKGVQSSMCVALSVTYTLDSYRDIGGEAMVTVMLIRNSMSFAMNYGVTPWIARMGLQNTFIVAAVISLLGFATFLPMVLYGKKLRERSAPRYRRYVEQAKRLGLVH